MFEYLALPVTGSCRLNLILDATPALSEQHYAWATMSQQRNESLVAQILIIRAAGIANCGNRTQRLYDTRRAEPHHDSPDQDRQSP